jgi:uncharacterized repeat protein (TIGR01451 family)
VRRNKGPVFQIIVAFAASWLLFCVVAQPANASHFRYGHYFWSPLSGSGIEFTLQNAWRRDANPCIDPATQTAVACSAPDGLPAVGDVILESTGGTTFSTGDGSVIGSPLGPLEYLVTAIDPSQNFLFGLALDPTSLPVVDTTITHTYPASGDFLAFTDSCCRIGQLVNNSNGGYRVETLVNVGTGNSSPVSALPPIVQCPINAVCSFLVPGSDPDGDPLQFRLSTSAEASSTGGFTQPGPPFAPNAASIDPSTGQYTWDTTGATLAASGDTLYSTQVTIEDRDPVTGAAKSKVALDFIIKLTQVTGVPPQFDSPPTPACGSTLSAPVGNQLTFTVQASDADAGQTVTLNAAGLPLGATMNPPLPTAGNPVSSTFSWTPTGSQTGSHVVTFSATDDTGLQALCSVTIQVTTPIGVDLSISKTDAPDPIAVGGNLTYTLNVSNNGPGNSTDSTVTDPLPPGVTFVSATVSQGTCSQPVPGTVTCILGPLATGASATVQIVVAVTSAATSPLSDTATVSGVEPDPVPGNNSATAETTLMIPQLDHFKCYALSEGDDDDDDDDDEVARPRVTLEDQFGSSEALVGAPAELCNPVSKEGGTINQENAHLVKYKAKPVARTFSKRRVEVTNQFGTQILTVRKPAILAVPSSKSTSGPPGAVPTMLDHFQCYRVIGDDDDDDDDGGASTPRTVVLKDQFKEETVRVRRPIALCNPVTKTHAGQVSPIGSPDAHLVCYAIRAARFAGRVNVRNQFGEATLRVRRPVSLCVPAQKRELPPPLPDDDD